MSTSPTFKYRGPDKRCPFPFNQDAAIGFTSPSAGASVALTETSGDLGLAEACRLWWLLESASFTISATFSTSTDSETGTYTGSGAHSSVQPMNLSPVNRVGWTSSAYSAKGQMLDGLGTNTSSYTVFPVYTTSLAAAIVFSSGRWRLQCCASARTPSELFVSSNMMGSAEWAISDATTGMDVIDPDVYYGNSVANSGNVDLFGYSFPTRVFCSFSTFYPATYPADFLLITVTDKSMAVTPAFYTLV